MNKNTFSIRDTNILKGIAILFMVLHHTVGLYYNRFDLSWYGSASDSTFSLAVLFFSTAGKVCVSLFTVLSGYGLTKSFEKFKARRPDVRSEPRFLLSHYIRFYSIYWVIFILSRIVGIKNIVSAYFANVSFIRGFARFILDFFGISKLFWQGGSGDWFVSAILILYLLFPLLYRLTAKLRLGMVLIGAIPWILRYVFSVGVFKMDSFLFCILAFVTGIFLANEDILSKLKSRQSTAAGIISAVLVLITFVLRIIFSMPADYFFALSLIMLEIFVVSKTKVVGAVLRYLGENSANMWLIHPKLIPLITIHFFPKYFAVLLLSLALSVIIELFKRITRFNDLVKHLRDTVEGKRIISSDH